jgi:hypothetical protein
MNDPHGFSCEDFFLNQVFCLPVTTQQALRFTNWLITNLSTGGEP